MLRVTKPKINVKVKVLLFGKYKNLLTNNEFVMEVEKGETPYEIIKKLNLPEEVFTMTIVNHQKVNPKEVKLRDGDFLFISPLMAGG